MSELIYTPAFQLAQRIQDGTLSSAELLDAYLTQIANHNPKLNAICTLDTERAQFRAKQADEAIAHGEHWGPLHGIPMTVKDVFETQGLRTTSGYKPLQDYVPEADAGAVAKLKAAGAIIMGKSNMAQLAGDYQSTNSLFPRVNNPWNLEYTAGGSSGGSAAAIAAGLTPLELGNDGGGSARQPAHFCGVYSIKPTDRRISTRGCIPEYPGLPKCLRQIFTVGCFARCVQDLRLCFEVVAGADPLQPDVPPVPLDIPSGKTLPNLRIAWSDQWNEVLVDGEIRTAIQGISQTLAQTGAEVQSMPSPLFDLADLIRVFFRVAALTSVYSVAPNREAIFRALALMYREATQGEPKLRRLGNLSQFLPNMLNSNLKQYFTALTERDRRIVQMDQLLDPWDVYLCPVSATPAFTHRPSGTAIEIEGRMVPYFLASGAYTIPFSLSGHPVVVIPIGQTRSGLPIGMQIVGKRWREMELLAIAQEIDRVVDNIRHPECIG